MNDLLRFVAAIALLGIFVTLHRNGIPIPPWLAGLLLLGGLLLLLHRGNLARKIVAVLGAVVVIYVLWGSAGGAATAGYVAVLALIMLALTIMFRPFWRGRY